ncbi:MAG: M20 family metallopeptidase, partial [Clostridia bacterium]|nr:M20 family metallopeptidase [Clostridia bacterium]
MDIKQKLYDAIENNKEELFGILSDLIKINSENFGTTGNEAECARYIDEWFKALGFVGEVYSPLDIAGITENPDYYAGRNLENRFNYSLFIPGVTGKKTLTLAAHIDTVEIGNLADWERPALSGEIADGKIFGRGACDDKYGIALSMFLIKKMKELGIELDYNLVFSAYCDEELGGSNGALACSLKYQTDDCLNLDGMLGEISGSGVGGGEMLFKVSHKSPSDNCDSVLKGMNLLVKRLDSFKNNRINELSNNHIFSGSYVAQNPMRIMYSHIGNTGGTNMDKGEFKITFYTDKEESIIMKEFSDILLSLEEEFEALGLNKPSAKMVTRFFRYVEDVPSNPVVEKLLKLGAENDMPLKSVGMCLSDLPMFNIYGSKRTVTLGLARGFGEIGGAHQVNEFIDCDE